MTEVGSIRQGIGQVPVHQQAPATAPDPSTNPSGQTAASLVGRPSATPPPSEIDRRLTAAKDRPAGPPPAFEASLLEIEADIDAILKRLEAAREKDKTDMAIRPVPDASPDITNGAR